MTIVTSSEKLERSMYLKTNEFPFINFNNLKADNATQSLTSTILCKHGIFTCCLNYHIPSLLGIVSLVFNARSSVAVYISYSTLVPHLRKPTESHIRLYWILSRFCRRVHACAIVWYTPMMSLNAKGSAKRRVQCFHSPESYALLHHAFQFRIL